MADPSVDVDDYDFTSWRESIGLGTTGAAVFSEMRNSGRPAIPDPTAAATSLYEWPTDTKHAEMTRSGEHACDICFETMMILPLPTTLNVAVHSAPPPSLDNGQNAPIPERAVSLKKCGHTFGEHCLTKWLRQSLLQRLSPTCPLCRTQLRDDLPLSRQGNWDLPPRRRSRFVDEPNRPLHSYETSGRPFGFQPPPQVSRTPFFDGRATVRHGMPPVYRSLTSSHSPPIDDDDDLDSHWAHLSHMIEEHDRAEAASTAVRQRTRAQAASAAATELSLAVATRGLGRRTGGYSATARPYPSLLTDEERLETRRQARERHEQPTTQRPRLNITGAENGRAQELPFPTSPLPPPRTTLSFGSRPYPRPLTHTGLAVKKVAQPAEQSEDAQSRVQADTVAEVRRRALEQARERASQREEFAGRSLEFIRERARQRQEVAEAPERRRLPARGPGAVFNGGEPVKNAQSNTPPTSPPGAAARARDEPFPDFPDVPTCLPRTNNTRRTRTVVPRVAAASHEASPVFDTAAMARPRSQMGLDSVDNADGTTTVSTRAATARRLPRFHLGYRETPLHTRHSEDPEASAYSVNNGFDPSVRQREMSPEIIPNPFRLPEDDSE